MQSQCLHPCKSTRLRIQETKPKEICAQSHPALFDPKDCTPPGSSVHGIFLTRRLEWVAISSSRGSSQPRDRTCVSCTASHQGSLKETCGKPTIVFFLEWLPTLKFGFPFLHSIYLNLFPFLSHLLCCLPFSWVFSPSIQKIHFKLIIFSCI